MFATDNWYCNKTKIKLVKGYFLFALINDFSKQLNNGHVALLTCTASLNKPNVLVTLALVGWNLWFFLNKDTVIKILQIPCNKESRSIDFSTKWNVPTSTVEIVICQRKFSSKTFDWIVALMRIRFFTPEFWFPSMKAVCFQGIFASSPHYPLSSGWSFIHSFASRLDSCLELGSQVCSTMDHC